MSRGRDWMPQVRGQHRPNLGLGRVGLPRLPRASLAHLICPLTHPHHLIGWAANIIRLIHHIIGTTNSGHCLYLGSNWNNALLVLIFLPVNESLIFAVNMEKITINRNITIILHFDFWIFTKPCLRCSSPAYINTSQECSEQSLTFAKPEGGRGRQHCRLNICICIVG